MNRGWTAVVVTAVLLAAPATASATTYPVGPGRTYTQPAQVAGLLNPGDEVLLDGGATYASVAFTRAGSAAQPIVIRGVPLNGVRPRLSGGANTIELAGDHYVVEGLDITGGSSRCLYHHADDITVRDSVVHDCPAQGILGADNDSGSLTLQYVEVHHCGSGTQQHQIYMATDEVAHPGSVFRMEHSYVHDANGGNNVKSRAERNEIRSNWIEGATYHELELIGPDPAGGVTEGQAREDSDVVGNVLIQRNTFFVARLGGDGTGQSNGRYRFAFNTIVTQPSGSAVFRLFDGLDSVEMDGNVFVAAGGATVNLMRDTEAVWSGGGRAIAGAGNWVRTGSLNIPPEWTAGVQGTDPGFADLAGGDLRPTVTSPLVDAGPVATAGPPGHPFPAALTVPAFHPPPHALQAVGGAEPRPLDAPIDIGAYEYPPPPAPAPAPGPAPGPGTSPGATRDTTPPAFLAASLTPATFAVDPAGRAEAVVAARALRGTTFTYRLSESARVLFTIERREPGRRTGSRCERPSKRNAKGRSCVRFVDAGRFAQTAGAGSSAKAFSGRIGRRSLTPGRYRATLIATDAARNASSARRLAFTIVRR